MNKELIHKIMEKVIDLVYLADRDEMIYGDSFVEFGERCIRVIEPKNISITHNKNNQSKDIKMLNLSVIKRKDLVDKNCVIRGFEENPRCPECGEEIVGGCPCINLDCIERKLSNKLADEVDKKVMGELE